MRPEVGVRGTVRLWFAPLYITLFNQFLTAWALSRKQPTSIINSKHRSTLAAEHPPLTLQYKGLLKMRRPAAERAPSPIRCRLCLSTSKYGSPLSPPSDSCPNGKPQICSLGNVKPLLSGMLGCLELIAG